MTTTPYAKLLVSRNGGATTSGGITAAFGDSIQLSSEDVAHPNAFRYEIYEHPAGFTCPAGWSTAADGRTYYYAASATPPAFSLPSSHGTWGDFLLRLTINNGDPSTTGLPKEQFIDESTALRLVADSGLTDTAFGIGTQFNALGAIGDLKANLRLIDVGLGSGFGTGSIADHAVTYVKIQQANAHTLLGNPTGGTANVQEVTLGGGVEFSGTTVQRSALTGDVTAPAGSNSTTIAANAVDFTKQGQIGVGLVGNDTGTANPKLIGLGASLGFSGGNLILAAAGVALSMLANIGAHTFLGNNTGSSAAPIALTATQLTAELNVATTTLKGLVPAPGTATGKFLNDSLAWATPTGTFTSPANPGDNNKIGYATGGAIAWAASVKTDGTYLSFGATPAASGVLRLTYGNIVNGMAVDGVTTAQIYKWGQAGDLTDNCIIFGDTATTAKTIWNVKTGGSYFWNWNGTGFASFAAGGISFTQQAVTTGAAPVALTVTGAAHTGLTASTEPRDVTFALNRTVTMLTGDLTNARAFKINAPTYAFGGASNVGAAVTLSIDHAPVAGANATFTNQAALQLESGALAFGGPPANATTKVWSATGLIRTYANVLILAAAGALGSYDIPIVTTNGSDQLIWGGSGTNSPVANIYDTRAAGTHELRIGGIAEATLSSTQLDLHSNNIVNVVQFNGVTVAQGVLGTALADAPVTLSVSGGAIYELNVPISANRNITLGVTGSPRDKQVISIRKYSTAAFNLTVTDDVGTALYTFPQAVKGIADFQYSAATGHFVLAANANLA